MIAAAWPRHSPKSERLLVVDTETGIILEKTQADLSSLLDEGDLLVVNDAATLPASLRVLSANGEELEVRLLALQGGTRWSAVLFGAGDWRTPTEQRPPPPRLAVDEILVLQGSSLSERSIELKVVALPEEASGRLGILDFVCDEATMFAAIYAAGRPVQYAYLNGDIPLSEVQTSYASRPWAVEMPSAGRALTGAFFRDAAKRGVHIAFLTEAAGLSSTGDESLDALMPFPERYFIPSATVDAIHSARARGKRVVAVGSTVVRALEGAAVNFITEAVATEAAGDVSQQHSLLREGAGITSLRIGPEFKLKVVDSLLTGMHEREASHYSLMQAFDSETSVLDRAQDTAEKAGYLIHEFGDSCLILGQRLRRAL